MRPVTSATAKLLASARWQATSESERAFAGKFVELLPASDALAALQAGGWQPQTDRERALAAVAAGDLDAAIGLGAAAADALALALKRTGSSLNTH